jgi:arylsulfatase A-like enzyme
MRQLVLISLVLLATLVMLPAEGRRPNLVFLIADDHAWTDYGFMNHPHIETPHLDRLASSGVLFTRGYVPTALCRPALASLATGLYAHQHLITGNDPALLPGMLAPGALPSEPPEYRALRERLITHLDRHPTIATLDSTRGQPRLCPTFQTVRL